MEKWKKGKKGKFKKWKNQKENSKKWKNENATQTCLCIPLTREFDRDPVQENTKRRRGQGKIQRAQPASQLFSAMPPLEAVKVLVSIMMSVSLSNKGTPLKFSRAHPETHLHHTTCRGSSEVWRRQSWQIGQEQIRNSRCFPHLATWYREPDQWRVRRLPKRQTQCSICFTIRIKVWELQCTVKTLYVVVRWRTSTVFLNPNTKRKIWEHLDSKIQTLKGLLLLNRGFQSGSWSNWTAPGYWTWFEKRSTHHQWIRDAIRTLKQWAHPREKLQDKLVSDGRRSPILKRNIWPREWASLVNSTLSRWNVQRGICCESPKAALTWTPISLDPFSRTPFPRRATDLGPSRNVILKTRTCWQDHSLRWRRLCWRPSLEKKRDGIGGSDR